MNGLTSIVIPCYDQAHFLGEAIASALSQDNVEVVVVDDGSTDGCAGVAERHQGVAVLRQENQGVARARNAGARAARGEFLLFLDADDRLRPGAVAVLRSALEGEPEAPFAFARFETIDDRGVPIPTRGAHRHPGAAYESLLQSNFICAPATVLYRRAALLAAGGFPAGLDPAADYALYLQLARGARPVEVGAVVADYRAHAASMSRRADRMLKLTLRAHARERGRAVTPELRRAWVAGRRHWRRWYGDQLMDQIRAEWRARRLPALVRDVFVLARYAPGVLAGHAWKKAGLLARSYRTRYNTNRPSS